MTRVVLVALALLAVGGFADPIKYVPRTIVADKVFLKKQMDILGLYYHIHEPTHEPEYKQISETWSLDKIYDHCNNLEAVKTYLDLMLRGRLLPRGVPFALFQPEQQFEAVTLFKVLYSIKDYDTLYKTVVYLRNRVNEGLFVYVLAIVTLFHPETQGIVIPPIYEVFPSFFFNGEIMNTAQRLNTHGPRMLEHYPNTYVWEDNIVIKWNETVWPYYNKEFPVSYFTHDFHLNTAYYNFHLTYPFWLNGATGPLAKYKRGENWWYLHKQILSHYYMDRLSNGLGEIPELDYDLVQQGYRGGLVYHNGIPFPSRPNHFSLRQPIFIDYMTKIKDVERRIRNAIDLGYIIDKSGKFINIRTPESIDILGLLIDANVDSPNPQYYPDFIGLWKTVLGNSLGPSQRYINGQVPLVVPSVLEHYQSTLRDPAFYMICKHVMKLFKLWASYLPSYKHEELALPSVKIEKVEVDKLVTYFENVYVNVTNHLHLTLEETKTVTDDVRVLVQQPVLNHKPFNIRMHVKSNVAKTVVVRYFLAPKYDSNGVEIPLHLNTDNFFQLDEFVYELSAGECVIKRESNENEFMIDKWTPAVKVYQKAFDAYHGHGEFVWDRSETMLGYPRHLMLPKGRVGGMPFVLMSYIHEYVAPEGPYGTGANPENTFGLGTGARRMTNYPLDFPLDRPLYQWQVDKLDNIHFQDVTIYHKPIPEMYNPFHSGWESKKVQLLSSLATMKTVLILASLVALAAAVPTHTEYTHKTKPVEPEFVTKQKKVLSLFFVPTQVNVHAEYYKIGTEYNIEAHIENYTNQKAVQEFFTLYKLGFMPKNYPFSIFYEKQKQEAIALFHLFFYAKDFETFYKTAAYARVHINEGVFLYAYYIAVVHRPDTQGIVLPAPYEIYPELFANAQVWHRAYRGQMQGGIFDKDQAKQFGIVTEDNYFVYYSNYSDALVYPNEEYKLSYFTEDIGLNAYYYYFHAYFPFWMDGDEYPVMKERRGEAYYYFYQQLLARYYLERLSNSVGEIPEFSWRYPIKTGYYPPMVYRYPFAQRPNDFQIPYKKHIMELQFLDTYEKTFIQYLEKGHFKAYNQEVDLHNSKSINFVGDYWQANYDLYKVHPKKYHHSYEVTARHVLGAAPEPVDTYTFMPTALSFYQTSLRDPVFYQLYNKILGYLYEYKQYVTPYTQDTLHFVGVKINDVKVEKLVTYFEHYDFDISNGIYYREEQYKSSNFPFFKVRQPRLNHRPFTVTVDVKSDIECEAVFKFFLGPKYDSNGYPISLEENWKYFVELDWFVHKLTPGQNKVDRHSTDFFVYKEDSMPTVEVLKYVEQGKIPIDMSKKHDFMPRRLMLPRGTKDGFPYQLFVIVYPYQPAPEKQVTYVRDYFVDNRPLGYPFDRPVYEPYFKQPNMFFEDVLVHHEGEEFVYKYNVPNYTPHYNEVTKH
ncbi:uncharacterized protein [Epargyreus clarus]|uniref:uncharacterized protein n=1 Tax=Epargyreus clarus TaxID=520877 RepID=UPI003C2D0AD7